jgi:hypothetical protein
METGAAAVFVACKDMKKDSPAPSTTILTGSVTSFCVTTAVSEP